MDCIRVSGVYGYITRINLVCEIYPAACAKSGKLRSRVRQAVGWRNDESQNCDQYRPDYSGGVVFVPEYRDSGYPLAVVETVHVPVADDIYCTGNRGGGRMAVVEFLFPQAQPEIISDNSRIFLYAGEGI